VKGATLTVIGASGKYYKVKYKSKALGVLTFIGDVFVTIFFPLATVTNSR
jgi:hypothetical protein